MKRKYGFTLIELLAVIVILSIIALIASPIILNVIDESREKANLDSTYGIIDAAGLYFADNVLAGNVPFYTNVLSDLKYTGTKPDNGYAFINEDGQMSVAVLYGDKCYVKDYNSSIVVKEENISICEKRETLKDKISDLPTKEVNINGKVVNKVYGDESARTGMNNYVWFSGNLWQVMEVNEDDVKLITSVPVTSIAYGETSDYNNSWVKKWVEQEFYPTLSNKNIIVPSNYCLDTISAQSTEVNGNDSKNPYIIDKVSSHNKINSCSNSITSNIGIMSFEDYVYSYDAETPVYTSANFISGGDLEWTTSPYDGDELWLTWYNADCEYITRSSYFSGSKGYGHGIRPVISIKSDVLVASGTGKNKDPYILMNEPLLNEGANLSSVNVGNYIYLDESNSPFNLTYEKLTKDINYTSNKENVRYRVIEKNGSSIKVQRSDIIRNMDSNLTSSFGIHMPYYYVKTGEESEWCFCDGATRYIGGCDDNNYFKPDQGSGDYNFRDGENIGYFLNNNNNGFYTWFSDDSKKLITDTNFILDVGGFGKDYANLNNVSSNVYPQRSNDGEVSAKVGLPSWGNIYAGNDIDTSYWLINRYTISANSAVSAISSTSNGLGDTAGATWFNVRPVLSVKSSSKIVSGKGTMTEPYKLVS